ncbi:hypothetical protein [Natronococcus pandeyae]|uniref:hypothetical protein n=1 Tax=Natronococcus pandeyae TaxID=2055836 RepID=UPI001653049F|nr:hypothetical protein [Natronococcus pandeyae]
MLDPVPAPVETAIYLYFLVVATIGLSLHWRLWQASRASEGAAADEEQSRADSEQTID